MSKRTFITFRRIDFFIHSKSTGIPKEFARKLNISESTLYEYLSLLKALGAPIKYDKTRGTYYYDRIGRFKIYFEDSTLRDFRSEEQ